MDKSPWVTNGPIVAEDEDLKGIKSVDFVSMRFRECMDPLAVVHKVLECICLARTTGDEIHHILDAWVVYNHQRT